MKRYTYQEFVNNARKIHHNKYDYSKFVYTNSRTKGVIICLKHDVEFLQNPQHHLRGCGCRICAIQDIAARKYTTEWFITQSNKIHGNAYDYSLVCYISNKLKVKIICRRHGVFEQTPNSHISGKQGCPTCKKSKGELEVKKFLDVNNIKYVTQKKFDSCKGVSKLLPFDFYLPDYNICIEYDGIQHFRGWCRYKEQKEKNLIFLNKIRNNDSVKTNYCKYNNIKLIRIKYSEFKSIDTILRKEILKN